MLGIDTAKTNRLLLGAFIGMTLVSLVMPFFLVFGVNPANSLILFYLVPLAGVITAYVSTKPEKETSMATEEKADAFEKLLYRHIIVRTPYGAFHGRLRELGDKIIVLDSAVAESSPQSNIDRIFIERCDIKSIEQNEAHF